MRWLVELVGQATPPSGRGSDTLLTVLIAALTVVGGGSGFQFYKFRKQSKREDDSLIAAATTEAVSAARSMLEEYRRELDRAKAEIHVQADKLQAANDRIDHLEEALVDATADRAKCEEDLRTAIIVRDNLQETMDHMLRRLRELEAAII